MLCRLGWKDGLRVLALCCGALLAGGAAWAEAPEGFTALFNGKDLSGWSGDPRLWSVQDGQIIGTTDGVKLEQNSFLSTEKSYSDFVLRLKVKLRNHNSGIQFRSEQRPDYVVAGYQADVAEKDYFGLLYEERKRGIMNYWKVLSDEQRKEINNAAKLDDWNDYEITCKGDQVTMVLNGKTVCDINDPEGAKSGIIALQLHAGPGMLVAFKDLYLKDLSPAPVAVAPGDDAPLLPDFDSIRRERLTKKAGQFLAPEGFVVEQVASNELVGSVVNMTFDHLGRPVMAAEKGGLRILVDDNGDGIYDSQKFFCEELRDDDAKAAGGPGNKFLRTVHGLYYLGPGDVLAHANGPEGSGLYRATDKDGDDVADEVKLITPSDGSIGEHGPHAIMMGPDGYLYIMFGNHAHPDAKIDPMSPSRNTREDFLLPPHYDPRGHAVNIRVPGGTIMRIGQNLDGWTEVVSGFRNAFDFDINEAGELFTFDSDMEWDVGLPWWRPIRVVHAVPGGDYGWRTGTYNMPSYFIGTLPPMDDVGRGSPVGTCFYEHTAYPAKFRGAYFMGDWSRGRIRVIFPKADGGTFRGNTLDFIIGEPMNVTDLDVGPDGNLYFAIGGRGTNGGLYRVRYTGAVEPAESGDGILKVLDQPMPRSAWGRKAILAAKESMSDWEPALRAAARNTKLSTVRRLRALESLQVHGPQPGPSLLRDLAKDENPAIRAQAAYLLGTLPIAETRWDLTAMLKDSDAFVQRRAAEALVRSGFDEGLRFEPIDPTIKNLWELLDSPDRFVRYSAGLALARAFQPRWENLVVGDKISKRPRGAIEGVLQLILTERAAEQSDTIFAKLVEFAQQEPDKLVGETLLNYLRTLEMAYIRDVIKSESKIGIVGLVSPLLLERFPTDDWRVNRELQVVLAYMNAPGAIDALLAVLTPDKPQEEQIHTVYCLRAIKEGWTPEQRKQLVAWFDRGREMGGGASFEGHIEYLWQDTLALLTDEERSAAEAHKAEILRKRQEMALANQTADDEARKNQRSDLAQMGFQELAEFLEYDPMAYASANAEDIVRGRKVFERAKCATCHVFGTVGHGGGPDLSTVVSRFRRRDILEAIMFPSKVVSDQYVGVTLELSDLSDVTGMIVSESADAISLIDTTGQRLEVKKSDITKRSDAVGSIMPEGLLNTMSMDDLVALINFLERGGDTK